MRTSAPTPQTGSWIPLSPRESSSRADWILWLVVLGLVGLGIVMTYSASAILSYRSFRTTGGTSFFLQRELLWAALGITVMAITSHIDYRFFRKYAYAFLGLTTFLLIAVLLTKKINGAHRWFRLGPLSFQPAELAKISLVIYLANSLSRKAKQLHSFAEGFIPPLIVCGVLMLLLLLEPDLGTAIILWLVTLVMLFVAGTKVVFIIASVFTAAPVVYMKFLINTKWRLERIQAFLDPFLYQNTVGYQITSSLLCVGSGGFWGAGLGLGRLKFRLPEAHNDYILAVIGEELGFVGICIVIGAFAIFILRGIKAASKAKDMFGYYLAYGITTLLGIQAAINIGVVLGVLPTKGLTLPFISFGGSSLVVNLFAVGILLNISKGEPESPSSFKLSRIFHYLFPTKKNRILPSGGRKVVIQK